MKYFIERVYLVPTQQEMEWGKIDGSLQQISSGKYGIYGVNCNDEIWFRDGINNSHLGGVKWISIDGKLKYISAGNFGVWGGASIVIMMYF